MITAIVGNQDRVHFFREDRTQESIKLTYAEWKALYNFLTDAINQRGVNQQSWKCNPLFSHPGGFIAQKLVTP